MGLSYAEPLVDFTYADGLRIFYNNVDKEKANKQNNLAHVFFSIYPDLMDNKKEFGNRTFFPLIRLKVQA